MVYYKYNIGDRIVLNNLAGYIRSIHWRDGINGLEVTYSCQTVEDGFYYQIPEDFIVLDKSYDRDDILEQLGIRDEV